MEKYNFNGMRFDYRLVHGNGVEITRWYEPTEYVTIPMTVANGNPVISIGPNAFSKLPTLKKVIIPDSITNISELAFHLIDDSSYVYGDLYDLGWTNLNHLQSVCEIWIPEDVHIENPNAFFRITAYLDRRHRQECYENKLILCVPDGSATMKYFLENKWRIEKSENGRSALLMDEQFPFHDSWFGTMRLLNFCLIMENVNL